MIRDTIQALAACAVTLILCSFLYPAAVWVVAQAAFPHQAEGSLVERNGKVIGSELVAQPFASDKYFQPRPSAVDYKADAASGSNLGTKNPDLKKKVAERAEALKATKENPAPVDLVFASGAGLDPDISPEAARYQAERVAAARGVPVDKIRALVDRHTNRSGSLIGAPPRVNVLKLNLDLDDEIPAKTATTSTTPSAPPAPAGGLAEARTELAAVSGQVEKVRDRVEAIPAPADPDAVKKLEHRLSKITERFNMIAPLTGRVESLNARLHSAEDALKSLKQTLGETRAQLEARAKLKVARP